MPMTRAQTHGSVSGVCRRAAWGALGLAFLLLTTLLISPVSAWAQTFTVLHKFDGQLGGIQPPGGVVVDAQGNLYGVTEFGGAFDWGIVFKLDPSGRETVLHTFSGGDGLLPSAPLIQGPNGVLYGTTFDGGTPEGGACEHGCGTVFSIDMTGKHKVLHAFKGETKGANPDTRLVLDPDGNLYGGTFSGGNMSCDQWCGVLFKLDTAGKLTVLYSFTGGTDGSIPRGLARDSVGNLYGTTYSGGASRNGTVFKLDTTGKLTILYSFVDGFDGGDPNGLSFRDSAGNLYGTTNGVFERPSVGVAFKLDTANRLTVLHSFTGGTDGDLPNTLVPDKAGNLYGTTFEGGTGSGCYPQGCGVIFKLDSHGDETILHNFTGPDGETPNGLTIDGAGNLYGTTSGGGKGGGSCSDYGCGTVFKLTP
jgi:uncharacterized repeat protein (TIGR03803 family)